MPDSVICSREWFIKESGVKMKLKKKRPSADIDT